MSYRTNAHEIEVVEVAEVPSPLHSRLAGINRKSYLRMSVPFHLLHNQQKIEAIRIDLHYPRESKLFEQIPRPCLLQPTIYYQKNKHKKRGREKTVSK